MIPEDKPKICKKCRIWHVENCPECYGFGIKKYTEDGPIPVTAREAHDNLIKDFIKCPVCGGTPLGINYE